MEKQQCGSDFAMKTSNIVTKGLGKHSFDSYRRK